MVVCDACNVIIDQMSRLMAEMISRLPANLASAVPGSSSLISMPARMDRRMAAPAMMGGQGQSLGFALYAFIRFHFPSMRVA